MQPASQRGVCVHSYKNDLGANFHEVIIPLEIPKIEFLLKKTLSQTVKRLLPRTSPLPLIPQESTSAHKMRRFLKSFASELGYLCRGARETMHG